MKKDMKKPQLEKQSFLELFNFEQFQARSNALQQKWHGKQQRFFRVGGMTICLEADLDLGAVRFKEELEAFAVEKPCSDIITYHHHFAMPDPEGIDLGQVVYHKPPWSISRKNGTWYYRGIVPGKRIIHRMAVLSPDHSFGTIFSNPGSLKMIEQKGWHSLTLFPTDQVLLGPLLAGRNAVLLHAAAASINDKGFLFVGHSDAGKSTTMELLKSERDKNGLNTEILCDDRNILRKWPEGWRVHGTWSHGTTADVSPASYPLAGILYLEQSEKNEIVPATDRKAIWKRLLATLIRAAVTAEWWQKELDILQQLVEEVPFYTMRFDKSGAIVPKLVKVE